MPNVYFLGPHPGCNVVIKPFCTGTIPNDIGHCSPSPDGTQCLSQGNVPQSMVDGPPVGYAVKTYAEALIQRQAWDLV